MIFYKKLVILIFFFCICKFVDADESYKIEILSDLNEELVLKLKLTNIGEKPIRYNLAALNGSRIRIDFQDKMGGELKIHQMFILAQFLPYYRLLNPGEYIERESRLMDRFPTIKEVLKTQALIVNWSNEFYIVDAKSSIEDRLITDKSVNRQTIHAGGSHTIEKNDSYSNARKLKVCRNH